MLFVLWIGLILNSILITKQVSQNFKRENSLSITRKIYTQTTFKQKFKNFRKELSKDRRNIPKLDINDWGYEDISEPLQYNYKDVWWTNYYPEPGETKRTTKINSFYKKITNITTKPTHKIDNLPTTKVNFTNKLQKPNNITKTNKIFTNVTKRASGEPTKTTKILVRSEKSTTQIKNLFTKFTDENMGYYLPVLTRNDNGEFSVLVNSTNLLVKKNENDSNVRGSIKENVFISKDLDISEFDFVVIDNDPDLAQRDNSKRNQTVIQVIKTNNVAETIKNQAPGSKIVIAPKQSKILPKVVKDGIYRIEIPDQVTKKTSNYPQIDDAFKDPNGPQNNRPPRPLVEDAQAYHIQSGNNQQGPLLHTKRLEYRPGPYYNTKTLGQYGQRPNFQGPPFVKQGPFYNTRNPAYDRQRPFYGTNFIGQNGRGRFYNTENPGFYPRPFYGSKNIGQNRQGPFYNTQNPGFENQGPFNGPQYPAYGRPGLFYGTQNIGQNRQFPFYSTQNPGFENQGPFYSPPNPDYGKPVPYYSTNDFRQHEPNFLDNTKRFPLFKEPTGHYDVQNLAHDIQGPSYSTNGLEHNKTSADHGRQGHPPKIEDEVPPDVVVQAYKQELMASENPGEEMLFQTTALTNAYREVVETTRSTFEPGKGPLAGSRPVYFEGPDIGPISPYVRQLLKDMKELKTGFFSMFLIRFFEIIAKKKPEPLRKLMSHSQIEATILFNQEHLLPDFGEPFGTSMQTFANHLDVVPTDYAKSAASMLHYAMVNRREGVTLDINSVIDYIDSLYEDHEGVELLRVAEDIDKYPDGELDFAQLHRKLSKVLYEPVRRLSGTSKRQILIDSLNKVIENHTKVVPVDTIVRRQGSNLNRNLKFHFIKNKGQYTNNDRKIHQHATNDKSKETIDNKPNKRYSIFKQPLRSTTSMEDSKHAYRLPDKIKIKNNNVNEKNKNHRKENNTKRIQHFEINFSTPWRTINIKNNDNNKLKITNKFKTEIHRNTYSIKLLSKTKVNKARFTTKNMKNFKYTNNIVTEKVEPGIDKFNKLNEIIAEQILKAKVNNFNMLPNNTIRSISNLTSGEELGVQEDELVKENEEEIMTPTDISETETTTAEPFKESSISIKQNKDNKGKKYKLLRPSHLNKKEIRHLRQKHPEMYKKFFKHFKKHDKKHKKGHSHNHKKKSHHSKKKKRSKISRKIKNIEHHYEHLLKRHMMKKTHLKTRSKSTKKRTEEFEDSLNDQNDTNEYSYLYNSFKSIEKEISKDIKHNVMTTPKFTFTTLFKKARLLENDQISTNWFQYPIGEMSPSTVNPSDQMFNDINKNFVMDRSVPNFEPLEMFNDNINDFPKFNFNKDSSDEEGALKFNLFDAIRHDEAYNKPQRRALEVKEIKDKLRTFSSYSSEEAVLKTNIYKAMEFNKYHSRAKFSDIIKRDSKEKPKKWALRSELAISEMTSSSDDAENILKQKLKLRR